MEYEVYNETNKRHPALLETFYNKQEAIDYVRVMTKKAKNKVTFVVRCNGKLIFLDTTEHPRILKPGGGLSSVRKGGDKHPTMMIGGMGGGGGYSLEGLGNAASDRTGRKENDQEVEQDHGPQLSTPWCERWKRGPGPNKKPPPDYKPPKED